ncbi:S41 family peptidase [Ramlibacter algicola]|uniref:Tail specific protease domain-containing protein n=1 Tax=Ramlibacter algicola TaxID=2795217 RepID=A0A934PYL5_9BURK|nr:S41 family peptidase [Ramlibacter algicola]MBK0391503.1 hypothetical protein [Ramlibacter algicola]
MATSESIRRAYLEDLEAIGAFLEANDAGFQATPSPSEHRARNEALHTAREAASGVDTEPDAAKRLQEYLRAWRPGHLFVEALEPATPASSLDSREVRLPKAEPLSATTALLTLPTFFPGARVPLETLLREQRPMLESRPDWIVDVRGNDGGADTTYVPLLPWLMGDGWLSIGDSIFVTDVNLKAEETICDVFAPGDPECLRVTAESTRRMRLGREGGWVQQEYDDGWLHAMPCGLERKRPARVLVLMDARCGSSGEQFLLTVRQSFSVKLVGRSRTAGNLDASNLRPHLLPSGRRLWYATTLSNRVPGLRIDGIGVCPDILLPSAWDPSEDVQLCQRWLETGRW